jgi:aspartate aminotransferase-like enzyme
MAIPTINVSTGPVNITKEVQNALSAATISHRSKHFEILYKNTTNYLSRQFSVKKTYLLTGSGTAANEAMIWQLKMQGAKGLILSNGEFGSRLVDEAKRASLLFIEHKLLWGEGYDIAEIEKTIIENKISWILFCHCETSTGMVNDLDAISKVCKRNSCLCFVDCMSTVGTCKLDLSNVTMATASSGKGLASVPGLAIVFSNIDVISSNQIPVYFDLGYYHDKAGIPFTISSNLVNALYVSIQQKLQTDQFTLIKFYAKACHSLFHKNELLPYHNVHSKVFTIASATSFVDNLFREEIVFSHESQYLRKRDLWQLALFGYYEESELKQLITTLERVLESALICKQL